MRDIALRKQKDQILAPLAQRFCASVHPNWVSVGALIVGLASALAVVQQAYWAGLALWIASRILDGLDGIVARMYGKQSDFGGYLDLFLDFIVYLAIPIAFVVAQPTVLNLWSCLALISVYVLNLLSWSTLSAILEKRKAATGGRVTTIEMPIGLIEGAETIIFYTILFLAPAYVGITLAVMATLTAITAIQRVAWAAKHI